MWKNFQEKQFFGNIACIRVILIKKRKENEIEEISYLFVD